MTMSPDRESFPLDDDDSDGWGWRFHLIVGIFVIANALGVVLVGVEFIVLGWMFNVPCGLFHYFAIERPNDAGDPLGTVMIVAIPWAQSLLTGLVVGLGLAFMAWERITGSED